VANSEQSGLQYIGWDVLAVIQQGGAPLGKYHVFLPPIAAVDAIVLNSSSSSLVVVVALLLLVVVLAIPPLTRP
jgi:hypothetical protein